MKNNEKTLLTGNKTLKNELNWHEKIALFLRNIFKKPSKDGQRRLIKNMSTGKWEWTEGASPLPTTIESLTSHKINYEPKPGEYDKEDYKSRFKMVPYEPYRANRWTVSFPGIQPWFIQSFSSSSDTISEIEVILVVNQELQDLLHEYESISKNAMKRKLRKDMTLKMLDATGVTLSSYLYKNVEILNVDFLNSLSYSRDEILTCTITFKHEKRIKK